MFPGSSIPPGGGEQVCFLAVLLSASFETRNAMFFVCKIKRYGSRKVANKTQFWTVYLLRSSFFLNFQKLLAIRENLE